MDEKEETPFPTKFVRCVADLYMWLSKNRRHTELLVLYNTDRNALDGHIALLHCENTGYSVVDMDGGGVYLACCVDFRNKIHARLQMRWKRRTDSAQQAIEIINVIFIDVQLGRRLGELALEMRHAINTYASLHPHVHLLCSRGEERSTLSNDGILYPNSITGITIRQRRLTVNWMVAKPTARRFPMSVRLKEKGWFVSG